MRSIGDNLLFLPKNPEDLRHGRGIFWNPSRSFLKDLAKNLEGKKVLEIFAGNGLLAAYLSLLGVQVHATSILSGMDAHEYGLYYPVENIRAVPAVEKYKNSSDVLLVCWPTTVSDVLRAVQMWGPNKDIVFIGEITDYEKGHLGGCATDEFFEEMDFFYEFSSYRGNMMEKAVIGRWKGQK